MLKITKDHYLEGVRVCKDIEVGPRMFPKGIVIHFTATYKLDPTIQWFKAQKVDIHNIIDRNGTIVQMFPYNQMADHAGKSSWNGFNGLNKGFIGIEMMSLGPLTMDAQGKFLDCYGKAYKGEVLHNEMLGYKYWEPFTSEQMTSLALLCVSLCKHYQINPMNICGHHEASPLRKIDPGGSMPIELGKFRDLIEKQLT